MNKKLLFLITFLLLGIIAEAQDYFYYYNDEKIYLDLDLTRVTVNSTHASYKYLEKKYDTVSFSEISKYLD